MPPRTVPTPAVAPKTPAELRRHLKEQCELLALSHVKGCKTKATAACAQLAALLATQSAAVLLRAAAVRDPASPWRPLFGALADYLRPDASVKPKDVERLTAIVGAAERVGARLADDGSLDLLLKLTLDALCHEKWEAPAVRATPRSPRLRRCTDGADPR